MALLMAWSCWVTASSARAETRTHVVAKGQTLGAIAHRYHVTIDAICRANKIGRRDPIRPGQRLTIPEDAPDRRGAVEHPARDTGTITGGQQTLEVPGAPPAYYYEPVGRGRMALRPVIMVLHGRGADPSAFCARWAPVVRPSGWLVCPSAPHAHDGGRSWNNDWSTGGRIAKAALAALRKKHGGRVQLQGNTIVGFSEGAFVAMNVGVREARTFNRWLILAADDSYWGGEASTLLSRARSRVRRVYLITGEQDGVHGGTMKTRQLLQQARIPVRISHPADMGHTVELESKRSMYRAALVWLNQ